MRLALRIDARALGSRRNDAVVAKQHRVGRRHIGLGLDAVSRCRTTKKVKNKRKRKRKRASSATGHKGSELRRSHRVVAAIVDNGRRRRRRWRRRTALAHLSPKTKNNFHQKRENLKEDNDKLVQRRQRRRQTARRRSDSARRATVREDTFASWGRGDKGDKGGERQAEVQGRRVPDDTCRRRRC